MKIKQNKTYFLHFSFNPYVSTTNGTWSSYELSSIPAAAIPGMISMSWRLEKPLGENQTYTDNWLTCYDYVYDCPFWYVCLFI
jgi:hypothetical protein